MILHTSRNEEVNQLNCFENNNSQSYAKKIVLASKGETGYSPNFDVDENGIITLDEFNKYCEENNVNEKDKLKLMLSMQNSKVKDKIFKEDDKKDSRIYARKGDEKYVEEMDENKDSIVTYNEYIKYCQEYANSKDKKDDTKLKDTDLATKNAIMAYSDKNQPQPQIQVSSFV
ncbi:MAG: hypothetical protein IJW73_04885 [Candidatus Gastranaerophilales bacterium]|nr:hypothetical protein [Candidatus Gastranaerophilales bacterium]